MKVNEETKYRKHTLLYIPGNRPEVIEMNFFLNELLAVSQLYFDCSRSGSLEGVLRSHSQREKAILHLTARVWVTEKQQSQMKERGEAERNGRTSHAHPDFKEPLQFISLR